MANKASAEALSRAGDQFLGRSYSEMDCQEFIERCLEVIGIALDLKGSNAWFRKMTWTGTPEECKARFGEIPKGAFLFILAFDGGEVERGYHDGLGNAKHIGIKTGRGKGAIHSSYTNDCVCESKFQDKTIKNGGWNLVGLWDALSYGARIDALLSGGSADPEPVPDEPGGEDETMQKATVWATNGKPVKMRASWKEGTAGYKLYDELPVGTTVDVVERGDEWTQISYGQRKGWWMKSVFLVFGDVVVDLPPEDDFQPGDLAHEPADDEIKLTISLSRKEAEILSSVVDRISYELIALLGGHG